MIPSADEVAAIARCNAAVDALKADDTEANREAVTAAVADAAAVGLAITFEIQPKAEMIDLQNVTLYDGSMDDLTSRLVKGMRFLFEQYVAPSAVVEFLGTRSAEGRESSRRVYWAWKSELDPYRETGAYPARLRQEMTVAAFWSQLDMPRQLHPVKGDLRAWSLDEAT
jgi:hypothetical protein